MSLRMHVYIVMSTYVSGSACNECLVLNMRCDGGLVLIGMTPMCLWDRPLYVFCNGGTARYNIDSNAAYVPRELSIVKIIFAPVMWNVTETTKTPADAMFALALRIR